MRPGELLGLAHDLLEQPHFGVKGAWPRAVALLGRQALEEGLDDFWEGRLEGMKDASRRTQILCLNEFIRDRDVADGIKESWSGLTQACHHHPFELAPTEAELKMWLERVDGLVMELLSTAPESDL